MIAHVIDDLFDLHYITSLEETILSSVPVYTTNIANSTSHPKGRKGGTHRLCGIDIYSRLSPNRVDSLHPKASEFFDVFEIIEQEFTCPILLHRIDLNLQFYGMDGSSHLDTHEYTIMLMNNSEWRQEWGGQFQLLDDQGNVIEEHDYVPGRVIMFPSNIPHRGLAPLVKSVFRYSTVFRVTMEDDSMFHPQYTE